jgi:peptidoglycan pentaglycine glycine transferase (the first glycine)
MSLSFQSIDDRKIWDAFWNSYGSEAMFQSWIWGEVQQKSDIKVWRLGAYKEKKLVSIFQIVKVEARRGSFLHIRHGPIIPDADLSFAEQIISFLKTMAKNEHCLFVRISPLIENSDEHRNLLRSLGFYPAAIHAMDAEYCWVLDLSPSEEELLKNMRKTTRYEIKRAVNAGATVIQTKKKEDLHFFLELYDETSKRQGFVQHHGIMEEFELFSKEDQAMLFLGNWKGEVVSAAIVLFCGKQAIYHHGASIRSEIPLSYLIQWEAIKEAKRRGMVVYNFWGIAPEEKENHPWKGITLFKKGFGGGPKSYIHAHDLPVSPLYILPRTIETVRRIRKGY